MDKLIFSCNWGKHPEKAWSGTSKGLYDELTRHYEIEKLNICPRTPLLAPLRCMEKLGLGRFDMIYMRYFTRVFLRRYGKKTPYTVFQFDECPNVPGIPSYVFQDMSISFLLNVYENIPELIPYCGLENLSKRYLEKRIVVQNEFYRNARGIFVMGQWLADYLVQEGIPKEKVHAVGGGINVDIDWSAADKRQGNKILFVGRDFHRKGGELVVEAFRILRGIKPEAELVIAGPARLPFSREQLTEGICFRGELDRRQLNELYRECDVFCMPSHFEAYGLVFAEALVNGLPCIGRRCFAMPEFIQDGVNGYLIDNDDAAILADRMKKALEQRELHKFVEEHRQQYLEKYSWKTVVDNIVKVIENGK